MSGVVKVGVVNVAQSSFWNIDTRNWIHSLATDLNVLQERMEDIDSGENVLPEDCLKVGWKHFLCKTSSRSWRMRYGRQGKRGKGGHRWRKGNRHEIKPKMDEIMTVKSFKNWYDWADWDRDQTFKRVLKSETFKNWDYDPLTDSLSYRTQSQRW